MAVGVTAAAPAIISIGSIGPWNVAVTLIRMEGLPKMDLIGKCDGFGRLTHGPIGHNSPVVKKSYNPVFNHTYPPLSVETFSAPFVLDIYDWDRTGSNDFIGKLEFAMPDLIKMAGPAVFSASTFIIDQTLNLPTKKKASTRVVLRFSLTWPVTLQHLDASGKRQWWNGVENNKIHATLRKWKISDVFHMDLMSLQGFDVVMVLDDSGSMSCRVDSGKTRWDELKEVVKIAVDVAVALDPDGIDLIFLNRSGADRIQNSDQAKSLFNSGPSGTTPLTKACKDAFSRKTPGKPMICLIATDGSPNNLKSFTQCLRERDPQIYLGILACSDNDKDVGYLNKLDKEIPHLDVLDDYESERKEVRHITKFATYSLADHVARLVSLFIQSTCSSF